MADDIKVIKADDLLKGVKLTFRGQAQGNTPADSAKPKAAGGPQSLGKTTDGIPATGHTVSAIEVPHPAGEPAAPGSTALGPDSSLLERIATSLSQKVQSSDWLVPPGQPNDWRFMLAVCRAALVAWFNPAATLPDRLALAEAVGRAFGLDDSALEQAVAESLVMNTQISQQLALQHAALRSNTFAVDPASFPSDGEGVRAYQEFRREAMMEAEQLLEQQTGLPAFNGMLQVEVVGATGLKMLSRAKSGSKQLLPYAVVWLSDKGGNRRGEKLFTQAASDPERPVWIQQLNPMPVPSPDSELVVQVRCAHDGNRPSRSDPLVGRVAVRLAGLTTGLTQQVDLYLYGQRETARASGGGSDAGGGGGDGGGGGFCRCFGGGGRNKAQPVKVPDATAMERVGSADQMEDMEGGGRLVFDPATSLTSGTKDLREAGRLTLMLRYIPERRERVKRAAESAAPGPAGPNLNTRSNPNQFGAATAVVAAAAGAMTVGRSLTSLAGINEALQIQLDALHSPPTSSMRRLRRLDSRKIDPVALMDPGVDFHETFRKLAAALQALATDRWVGASALAAVPDSGIPLTALGALGQFLEDTSLEAPLERFIPRALGRTGLSLLLLFAKLFRVRTATQQVVLLHALLGDASWDPASPGYLELVKGLWEPLLRWKSDGHLTIIETEGLNLVNATFLLRACPLLANHYELMPGETAVSRLVLLIEMVGWAVTGVPRHLVSGAVGSGGGGDGSCSAPLHLLIDHMQRAAIVSADTISALRPTMASLPSDVEALTAAAQRVLEQLEQDLRLQAEIPGLRTLTRTNCRVRYDALADALETLFMYRPGSSKAASTALWPLEVAVTQLHGVMLRHSLARQPNSTGSTSRRVSSSRRRKSGNSASTTSSPQLQPSKLRETYSTSDSDVSPVSVESGRDSRKLLQRRRRGRGRSSRNGTEPWASCPNGSSGGAGGRVRANVKGDNDSDSDSDDDDDNDDEWRTAGGGGGGGGGGGEALVFLFDFETAMAEAMGEWAELGGDDLKRQLIRLLERDPLWPPPPPPPEGPQANGSHGVSLTASRPMGPDIRPGLPSQAIAAAGSGNNGRFGRALVGKALLSSGAGESAVELFRMLQVYLDISVERALSGGDQRPAMMGSVICSSVISCVRIYIHHCMWAWEEIILLRAPPADAAEAAAAGHRHGRTISDMVLNAIGVSSAAGSTAAAAAASPYVRAAAVAAAAAGGLSTTTTAAAAANGTSLGSFATPLNATGPSQVSISTHTPHPNGASSSLVVGGRPLPAPLMPEYGVMPAAAPGAALAMAKALSTAMAAGISPAAAAAAAAPAVASGGGGVTAGNSCGVGAVSQQSQSQPPLKKGGHRRAITASDVDTSSGVQTGLPGHAGSGAAAAAAGIIPAATALALASEPGFVACAPLVLIRNTIAAVAEGAEALTETLGLLAPRPPLITSRAAATPAVPPGESGKAKQQKSPPTAVTAATATATAASTGGTFAKVASPQPSAPAFLSRADAELSHALNLASEQCLNSYHLALRGALRRALLAAFDPEGARPASRTALESALSQLHDELLHVAGGVRQVAVAGVMIHTAWEAAVRCVWALALHQAGFRPITEEESDVLREFLISLQDMFGEVVSEHLIPRAKAAAAAASAPTGPTNAVPAATVSTMIPAVLLTADSRAAGTAYPSALLQCIAAPTQDLVDMYTAQISCLQKLDGPYDDEEAPGTGPGGHQVSLIDLLRILRPRRRTDPIAQTFLTEQLRLAASNATQVLFGLRASERLVATASCFMAPPAGVRSRSAGEGYSLSLPLEPVGVSAWGRDGCLYVTSRALGFSTMLVGDLKGSTDVTILIKLKAVREVAKGEKTHTLLVLTNGGDLHQFCGLSNGDRDRLYGLLNGQPIIHRVAHPAGLQVGGGGDSQSHQNSPRRSNGGQTPTTVAGSGGGGGGVTPSGALTPKGGLPKAGSQPSNLAAALLSAFTSPSAAATAAASAQAAVAANAPSASGGGGGIAALNGKLGRAAASATSDALAVPGAAASVLAAGSGSAPLTGGGISAAVPMDSGSLPLLSAPCYLVNVLRNKDGLLNLYASRLDFVCTSDPGVSRSMPLEHINNVSQKPAGWSGGSVLMLSLEGDKAPVQFGGIGDALLATLKQTISELCFSRG